MRLVKPWQAPLNWMRTNDQQFQQEARSSCVDQTSHRHGEPSLSMCIRCIQASMHYIALLHTDALHGCMARYGRCVKQPHCAAGGQKHDQWPNNNRENELHSASRVTESEQLEASPKPYTGTQSALTVTRHGSTLP